jgi:hypothetical protein
MVMTWWGYGTFDGDFPCAVARKLMVLAGEEHSREYVFRSCATGFTHRNDNGARDLRAPGPISLSTLFSMYDMCLDHTDALEKSAAMTVLASFVMQNRLVCGRTMFHLINDPIQNEVNNISEMGWHDSRLRLAHLREVRRSWQSYNSARSNAVAWDGDADLRRRYDNTRPATRDTREEQAHQRSFVLEDKFWTITRVSGGWIVRFGRRGSPGRRMEITGTWAEYRRVIRTKLQKGYREVT